MSADLDSKKDPVGQLDDMADRLIARMKELERFLIIWISALILVATALGFIAGRVA